MTKDAFSMWVMIYYTWALAIALGLMYYVKVTA